jgi:hypothetical protein
LLYFETNSFQKQVEVEEDMSEDEDDDDEDESHSDEDHQEHRQHEVEDEAEDTDEKKVLKDKSKPKKSNVVSGGATATSKKAGGTNFGVVYGGSSRAAKVRRCGECEGCTRDDCGQVTKRMFLFFKQPFQNSKTKTLFRLF